MSFKLRFWLLKLRNPFRVAAAIIWRRCLRRTRFIAITGSVGKTTAKDCLVAMLSVRHSVVATIGSNNGRSGIPGVVLRSRPSTDFAVVEIGILDIGRMWRSALVVSPDDAVVTCVQMQHMRGLKTLDIIAREKAKLLRPLGKDGVAVLNHDDERVAAMASAGPFRVCYFGESQSSDVWADEIVSAWPERLQFTVHMGAETQRVRTRFVGSHWTQSVLAAIAMATRQGITLAEAAAAVKTVEPYLARMQPVTLPGGAVMIRDEYNGGENVCDAAFAALSKARAERKIGILGEVSDTSGTREETYRRIGQKAAALFDVALFVGRYAEQACQAARKAGMSEDTARWFSDSHEAGEYLRGLHRPGDLILLKGEWYQHHSRIYLQQLGTVRCRLSLCLRHGVCDNCKDSGFVAAENG